MSTKPPTHQDSHLQKFKFLSNVLNHTDQLATIWKQLSGQQVPSLMHQQQNICTSIINPTWQIFFLESAASNYSQTCSSILCQACNQI